MVGGRHIGGWSRVAILHTITALNQGIYERALEPGFVITSACQADYITVLWFYPHGETIVVCS